MEFLDEETRPKVSFQSRVTSSSSSSTELETQRINKPIAFICVFISVIVSLLTIFFIQSETLRFVLLWFSIAFIVGPFAPISITGGDIRVGEGEVVEFPDQIVESDEEIKKRVPNRRNKSRRSEEPLETAVMGLDSMEKVVVEEKSEKKKKREKDLVLEEKEWTDGDFDLLKKQITKHPVGTPKRWELITEAFRGRHGVDNVIKTAKSFSEKKPGNGDSFSQFLKQRKPLDKRMEDGNGELVENGEVKKENGGVGVVGGEGLSWSSAEDIALLNALKAFPKEVSMRWEKIAVAVPGRSKASCMKRVAELKKGFRSSKASAE
ncbi:dnaJ-like protein [Thalictrum thalictroides]|uniref:DnaJ-like protein n=1 Tax=Thalictrum thalictroides TaxID=46969 RepID=A0A7J6V4W2_THATH|nr:dnaJ-like protein [Thalictrum thalictroides]